MTDDDLRRGNLVAERMGIDARADGAVSDTDATITVRLRPGPGRKEIWVEKRLLKEDVDSAFAEAWGKYFKLCPLCWAKAEVSYDDRRAQWLRFRCERCVAPFRLHEFFLDRLRSLCLTDDKPWGPTRRAQLQDVIARSIPMAELDEQAALAELQRRRPPTAQELGPRARRSISNAMSEVVEETEVWEHFGELAFDVREAAAAVQWRAKEVEHLAKSASVKKIHDWAWDAKRAFQRFIDVLPEGPIRESRELERCHDAFNLVDAFLRGETALGELEPDDDAD